MQKIVNVKKMTLAGFSQRGSQIVRDGKQTMSSKALECFSLL